jgi:hypothetical protein
MATKKPSPGVMGHKGKRETVKTALKHKQKLESDEASKPKYSKTKESKEKKKMDKKYVPLNDFKMAEFLRG